MKLDEKKYNIVMPMLTNAIRYEKMNGFVPSTDNIRDKIAEILKALGILYDEDDFDKIVRDIEYKEQIRHTMGDAIFDDYELKKWFFNDQLENNFFWNRYEQHISSKLDPKSIEILRDKTLPDIMNCLYDPNEEFVGKPRLKRGLIIGDVQSGKTATYSGLICKAADAGYKVVILLAGITESLRQQTQERIDEGIVGYTIRKVDKKKVEGKVGVGLDNKAQQATSFTSCMKDFVGDCNLISTSLSQHNSLILFVVKKNVSVLTKLYNWLVNQNLDVVTQSINHPMLLIDDEADNASVNTKKDDTDPTKTNQIIRNICNVFQTANYIGFTATPFANVFIDPDSVDAMKRADLFPEHFIYTLPTPSSYIGAEKIFYEDGEFHKSLRFITDIEEPDYASDEYRNAIKNNEEDLNNGGFYFRHKKEWHGILPESLKESIYCYYLANIVRDIRGQRSKPRSMLINMSRFVKVQRYIKEYVDEIHDSFINAIEYDFDENPKNNKTHQLYAILDSLWKKHFSHIKDVSFDVVIQKKNILESVKPIEKIVVNGSSASKLDYKTKPSLRVIAIGGLALSRGLTLEGLLVSYFYRNTATFDVLMQMGRWFGYRPGYADLFQIWTSQSSASWYKEIAIASAELKNDIKKMFDQHLTPKDFGIKVRDYCDELQITASSKMRTAYDYITLESYYGTIYDTPYLSVKPEHNKKNWNAVKDFTEILFQKGFDFNFADIDKHKGEDVNSVSNKSRFFSDVPKNLVIEFLHNVKCSMMNMRFNVENIIDFISDKYTQGCDYWDIVFEGGDGNINYDIPGLEKIRCAKRTIEEHDHVIQISTRRRILGLREGKFCLTNAEIALAEKRCREAWKLEDSTASEEALNNRTVPLKAYFEYLPNRKPMLIIMLLQPIKPEVDPKNPDKNKKALEYIEGLGEDRMIAFAAGFPGIKAGGNTKKYKVNKVYYQLNMVEPDETIEDEE